MLELKIGGGHDGMGALDFIASIIGSVAWPIAAVVIALAFRKQISGLLNKIRRLSWGDKSVDLAEQLDKVETASELLPDLDYQPPSPSPTDRFQRLLDISPSAAILDSWGAVEQLLKQIALARGYNDLIRRSPTYIAKALREDASIDGSVYEMIRDLSGIRNAAAHQEEVSATSAYRFDELAQRVIKALEKLRD